MATIILKDQTPNQMFMGAMLMTHPKFANAEVHLAADGEESNVTSKSMEKYCPSWTRSTLIALAIRYKVCDPVLDNRNMSLKEKLISIRNLIAKEVK